MTNLKFSILKLLYNTPPSRQLRKADILNSFIGQIIETNHALSELQSTQLIKVLTCSDVYSLTDLGAEAYEHEQDLREQKAKQKIRYFISISLTVLTLLSTILLSEPFIKLITWLIGKKTWYPPILKHLLRIIFFFYFYISPYCFVTTPTFNFS